MRTTINIETSLYNAARDYAHQSRMSIGEVITEWAKRGLNNLAQTSQKKESATGFQTIKSKTSGDFKKLEQLEDAEKYGKFLT